MYGFTSLILLILAAKSPTHGGQLSRHIIGGSDAPDGAYPYQVSLRQSDTHFCGGSIINNRWILTAAHCLLRRTADLVKVMAGTNKLNESGKYYQASILVIHEDFDLGNILNDIGLIGVTEDIIYNKRVQPISLPLNNFYKSDYPAVVSGWGTTENGPFPYNLQHLNVTVISQNQCKSMRGIGITDGNICTLTKVGEGICSGDSGSPLVSDGVQIGIVSWGVPCAIGQPDVYVRVWHFIDWIRSHTCETP